MGLANLGFGKNSPSPQASVVFQHEIPMQEWPVVLKNHESLHGWTVAVNEIVLTTRLAGNSSLGLYLKLGDLMVRNS